MAEACHNCRRQRLKCDRTTPTCLKCSKRGQKCLGYQPLLRWERGIASRGKMAGKSFRQTMVTNLKSTQSLPKTLTDPLLQDMAIEDRKYLAYFASDVCKDLVLYDDRKDNHFRELLPLTHQHPVLLHIIVANSAMRLSHVDKPIVDFGATICDPIPSAQRHGSLTPSHARSDALEAKYKSLALLCHLLARNSPIDTDVTLAVVLLFIELELLDSGRDNWTHHINGARRIIEKLCDATALWEQPMSPLRKFLVSNCLVFDILGSAFASSGSLTPTEPLDNHNLCLLQDAEGNHCSSFPTFLLRTMWTANHLSSSEHYLNRQAQNIASLTKQLRHLLHTTQSFDALAWATDLQPRSPAPDLAHRAHVASGHRAAVCIYLSRLILYLDEDAHLNDSLEPLVSEANSHMACIRQSDPLFTATTWPAFIAGAETNDVQKRAWAAQRFSELWEVEPWGTIRGALGVLREIWSARDGQGACRGDAGNDDWVVRLRQKGVDWLII